VPHATPNPVHGRWLYDFEPLGHVGAPISPMTASSQPNPPTYGLAGKPTWQVTIDASDWTGDVLCWTTWLNVDASFPFRSPTRLWPECHSAPPATTQHLIRGLNVPGSPERKAASCRPTGSQEPLPEPAAQDSRCVPIYCKRWSSRDDLDRKGRRKRGRAQALLDFGI